MEKVVKKIDFLDIIFIFVGVIVLVAINHLYFFEIPPVWPDEAIFLDSAKNFISSGIISTNIFGGSIIGLEKASLWYPPLYFYVLSFWIKAFGTSIETLRLLSLLLGISSIVGMYYLIKSIFNNYYLSLLGILLLSFDINFIRASNVGRMDILLFMFLIWSLLFFIISQKNKNITYFVIVGILCGLGILTHPLGFIAPSVFFAYLCTDYKSLRKNIYSILLIILPIFLSIIIWTLYIGSNMDLFIRQYSLQFERKSQMVPYLVILLRSNFSYIILCTIYLMAIASGVYNYIKFKNDKLLLAILGFIISSVVIMWGKEMWYLLYFQPFTIILLLYAFQQFKNNKFFSINFLFVLLILLIVNLNLIIATKRSGDYHAFVKMIVSSIPKNSKVFLSTIPDPYFDMQNKGYVIYEFPTVPIGKNKYFELLDKSDYIVINTVSNPLILDYIKSNSSDKILVEQPNGYSATIIKLKNK